MSKSNYQIKQERLFDIKKLGDTSAAITQIQELLGEFPDFILGWIELGLIYRRLGDRQSALSTFEEAIKLHPNNQVLKLELSSEQLYFNQLEACRKNLQELLEANPKNESAIIRLGIISRKENNRKKALTLFKKALKLNPENIYANIHVATELRYFERFDQAEEQLKTAIKNHPNHFNILMQLGELAQTRQKLYVALEYFQKAIENYPESIEPQLSKISVFRDLDRFDEAKNNLKILKESHPEDARILIHLGQIERRLGQREKALQWFRLAQEKASSPDQKLEYQILAIEELRDLGRLDEAIKLIDAIIQKFPDHIRAQMVKGSIVQRKPNLIEAANLYKSILSHEPHHLNSRIQLARIYSQSGQVETAITLLEETYQLLGANIQILMQLGSLNQALEDWETARQWYQKACQEYPDNPQGYCDLANLMFLEGETESAIQLLEKAQVKIPNSVPIIIKLIEFKMRLGNFYLSQKNLRDWLNRFPDNIQLLWQLCRVHMEQGDYSEALDVLDKISTDNQEWMRRTEHLRANIYLHQYDYKTAEEHFRKVISLAPIAVGERNQLACILMATGRIDQARQELKIATEELNIKMPPGKSAVPLKSHAAMVTNELRINPPLLAKLQKAQQETEYEKLLALSSLLTQEPTYLGTALYLARELREQGIFDEIQPALSKNSTNIPSIPKRIVQFWDEPEPPPEVQRVCQSWIDLNPEYEYTRFSLATAIAFLKEHYDEKVLKAFANCDQPATQADLFRLAYLNKMGGFYADADDQCRQSLDILVNLSPELVVLQEVFACIGNNFIGCIPGQNMIRIAFDQAVNNLIDYSNESPWFKTGPGLLTSAVCSGLVPYLTYKDYQMWPRIFVLTQAQLKKMINQHIPLAYKRTNKSWQNDAYRRRIQVKTIL
jgi:tetratricopeptide (TPR) repeat protein